MSTTSTNTNYTIVSTMIVTVAYASPSYSPRVHDRRSSENRFESNMMPDRHTSTELASTTDSTVF